MKQFRAVWLAASLAIACSPDSRRQTTTNPNTSRFPSSNSADSIFKLAQAKYKDSDYDSAATLFLAARTRAAREGDSSSVAQAGTWLGLARWHSGRYAEAQQAGEAALAMKIRLGLEKDFFKSYNALGLLAYDRGRYGEAAARFAEARASAEVVRDSISVAKAIGNLGMVHTDVGKFEEARREYEVLLRFATSAHDTISMANALANIGMLSIRAGDAATAIAFLERARPLYDAEKYADGTEMVLGQLGSAYADLGEPQRAIAYMDSARSAAHSHGMKREETEDLEIFAELFGDAGDHQAALRYLGMARALADSVGLEARAGGIARAQARELASIHRNDLALAKAQSAAEIHKKAGAPFEELEDRLLLAEIDQRLNRTDAAKEQLRICAQLVRSLSTPVADETRAIGVARVADLALDPAGVLTALPAELTFPHLGFGVAGESEALRARAFARLHQWPQAVNSGRRAVASLSLVRERLGEGALRAAYTSDRSQVYADLVIALLRLGRTDEAFEVADHARGRALLEHLNTVKGSARATSRSLSEADGLLRRIDYLTTRLRLADTVPNTERTASVRKDLMELASRLAEARSQYEDRMSTVARTDPRGASLLGIAPLRALDVRASLRPDEAVVEYLATDERLFTFVATRDTIVARSRALPLDALGNRVRIASQLSGVSRSGDAGSSARRALYGLLLGSVDSIAGSARRLIIVPHAALSYLPFAALIAPDGHALIERRSLLLVPSASALPYLRQNASPAAGPFSIFAPFPEELVWSLAEAKLVMREVKKPQSFVGGRATERQLRSVLVQNGNVHIASHAVLNQRNPMFSNIELVSGRSGDPSDDGRLDVHELLRMTVKSDLVYLSGCETGAGAAWSTSFRRGQDYTTLSQALLFAGAQNVVATLWRIDDAGASAFAERFYRAFQSNDVVDALAIAQREMLKDSRFAAPRYWAAYTVSGSGVSRPLAQVRAAVAVQ
ncbi:MAG: CHAT domain-containing tetratricopeptide repeat protein [Gemmatimonadaceae bacterium]